VDGNTFTLRKGDILFVDSHLPHSYESLGEAIVHFVSLSESFFEGLHFPRKIPRVLRAEQKSNFLFRLFKEATEGWENTSEQYKLGFAYSLCGALLRSYPLQFPNEQPNEERFTDVLKYIEEHFRETLTLDDLTHRFGYSKSYFSRTFNKVTGVNLREFLNRCRINEALRMKEANPSIPWVHITANVGFESWSTFARAYKRYCGNNVIDENTTN
jgi:AraC-like DNA-binding protein